MTTPETAIEHLDPDVAEVQALIAASIIKGSSPPSPPPPQPPSSADRPPKGQLEGVSYEEIRYEGYAQGGVAVMIETLTDNRNRTVAEVRHAFSKHGGNLGTDGSVAYLFDKIGVLNFAPGTDEDAVMEVRKSVEEGKTISAPLLETKVFPPMVCQMISVGEQTGALDQMLSKIADFYEDEVDTAVSGLMKLIEPIMIVILGVIIGTIVIAMYLPMFAMFQQIG